MFVFLVGTFSGWGVLGDFLVGGECLGNFMCVHVSGLWVSVNFIVWVYCVHTYNDNKNK